MPQSYSNSPFGKRSVSAPPSPPNRGSSGIFTADPAENPASTGGAGPASYKHSPSEGSSLRNEDLDATAPFPGALFRMPVPDRVFEDMEGLPDSALRSVLALTRLSFRFELEKSAWVCPERRFSRAEIQRESGLSSQGARDGLSELEEAGYVSIQRSGRSFQHALEMGVPKKRYTYLPTDLLERASSLTGTEIRAVMTVLRATWGWTTGSGEDVEHRRWARLSTAALAERTGRSETAIKKAVKGLQGRLLTRIRQNNGAYYYRFRPEALLPDKEEKSSDRPAGRIRVSRRREAFFSMGVPNEPPPDRQQTDPSRRNNEESFTEKLAKHRRRPKKEKSQPKRRDEPTSGSGSAVQSSQTYSQRGGEEISLSGFSDRKQELGQKLANIGVWAMRIPDLLGRFSAERIEANFELYRRRGSEMEITKPGAWLSEAITQGYALPSESRDSSKSEADSREHDREMSGQNFPEAPEPGTKVPKPRKEALIQNGKAEEGDFKRTEAKEGTPQYFYKLDPDPSPAAKNLRRGSSQGVPGGPT